MKSMKISNRRILPLVFLPFLIASCAKTPQSISYGHDTCSLCHGVIENQSFAAQALSLDGIQYNYDSVECMVQHLGERDSEMAVIKVADYQHPGHMLNAHKSHYKLNDPSGSNGEKLAALRHDRANSLCWKELKSQILEQSEYLSQSSTPAELGIQNFR